MNGTIDDGGSTGGGNTGGGTGSTVPATGFNLNNFGDAQNFVLNFNAGNNAGSIWQVLISDRPYATLPTLTANLGGALTVSSTANGDGTFNHLITSTDPIPANNNPSITISGSSPGGLQFGGPCTCISFFTN